MKRNLALLMGGLASASLSTFPAAVHAADHLDGAKVKMDHSTDINDVYAWMSTDKSKVYLAMTVFPQADTNSKFSTSAKYVLHLQSGATYGAATNQMGRQRE